MVNFTLQTHYWLGNILGKLFGRMKGKRDINRVVRDLRREKGALNRLIAQGQKGSLKGVERKSNEFLKNAADFYEKLDDLLRRVERFAQEELELDDRFVQVHGQLVKAGEPKGEAKKEMEEIIKVLRFYKTLWGTTSQIFAEFERETNTLLANIKTV